MIVLDGDPELRFSNDTVKYPVIQVLWRIPKRFQRDNLSETTYVKLQCSKDGNFTTIVSCSQGLTPIQKSAATIEIPGEAGAGPFHVKLDIIRNIDGDEILENTYTFIQSPFCLSKYTF